jgi:phytoene synthase
MRSNPRLLEEPYRSRAVPPATARYWSWLFAAAEMRDPLLGVYALTAEWRALRDPAADAAVAGLKLAWWREEIARLCRAVPVHPIGRYLAALPRAGCVDFTPLGVAVDAAARQIAGAPLERGAELEAHAVALHAGPFAVAAGLAALPASGTQDAVRGSLHALAAALYLWEAMADYRRDARHGRVLFPIEELLAANIEDADLTAAEPPLQLQSYLHELRGRAARLFAAASDLLPRAERATQRHLLVLAALGARQVERRTARDGDFRLRDLHLAWATARRAARQA